MDLQLSQRKSLGIRLSRFRKRSIILRWMKTTPVRQEEWTMVGANLIGMLSMNSTQAERTLPNNRSALSNLTQIPMKMSWISLNQVHIRIHWIAPVCHLHLLSRQIKYVKWWIRALTLVTYSLKKFKRSLYLQDTQTVQSRVLKKWI